MKNNKSGSLIFKIPIILIAIFLFNFSSNVLYGQTEFQVSQVYQIKLVDGGSITGKIMSQSATEIVVSTSSMGTVTLQKLNISEAVMLSNLDSAKGWFPNPNSSKYLLGNSAIPQEKGSGYYQNTWVFFSAFNYAFTDFLSVTGGFEIFSLLAGGDGVYAYYLNPKVSFEVADNLYLGANVLYANTIKTTADFGGLGTLNAFGTYGNENNNISLGVGWGFVDGEMASKPVISISGMIRASKRIAFVSENWLIPVDDYYGIFSYGIRFLGDNTSIDLAFINNPDIASEIVIGIPFLDFVINF